MSVSRWSTTMVLGAVLAVPTLAQLTPEWTRRIANEVPCDMQISSAVQSHEGGFAIAGIKRSGSESHAFAAKYSTKGALLWERRFGLAYMNGIGVQPPHPIHLQPDGDLIVAYSIPVHPATHEIVRLDSTTGQIEWKYRQEYAAYWTFENITEIAYGTDRMAISTGHALRVLNLSTGNLVYSRIMLGSGYEFASMAFDGDSTLYCRQSRYNIHQESFQRINLSLGVVVWSSTVPADSNFEANFLLVNGETVLANSKIQTPGTSGQSDRYMLYLLDAKTGAFRRTYDSSATDDGLRFPIDACLSNAGTALILWRNYESSSLVPEIDEHSMANGQMLRRKKLPNLDPNIVNSLTSMVPGEGNSAYLVGWSNFGIVQFSTATLTQNWTRPFDQQVTVDNFHRVTTFTHNWENEKEVVSSINLSNGGDADSISTEQIGPTQDGHYRLVMGGANPVLFTGTSYGTLGYEFDAGTGTTLRRHENWQLWTSGVLPGALPGGAMYMHYDDQNFERRFKVVNPKGSVWQVPLNGGYVKSIGEAADGTINVVTTNQTEAVTVQKFTSSGTSIWSKTTSTSQVLSVQPIVEVGGRVVACVGQVQGIAIGVFTASTGELERTVPLVVSGNSPFSQLRHWFAASNGTIIGTAFVSPGLNPYYLIFRFDPGTGQIETIRTLPMYDESEFGGHPEEAVQSGPTILIAGKFAGGNLTAIDANSGATKWTRQSDNLTHRVFVDDFGYGYVYESPQWPDRELAKLQLSDGVEVWRQNVKPEDNSGRPGIVVGRDGTVYESRNVATMADGQDIFLTKFRKSK